MKRHAEMQLTRFAQSKSFEIERLAVSKPPCCMCDTVLSSEGYHFGWTYTGDGLSHMTLSERKAYYDNVHTHVFTATSKPVVSGPQPRQWPTVNNNEKQPTGLQYGYIHGIPPKEDEFEFNVKSWYHPLQRDAWKFAAGNYWTECPGKQITNEIGVTPAARHKYEMNDN